MCAVLLEESPATISSDGSTRSHTRAEGLNNPQSSIRIIRHYLTALSPAALDAEAISNELAMRAKIILEYMILHSIGDVNHGIRQFTAFERERLHRLGMISPIKRRVLRRRS